MNPAEFDRIARNGCAPDRQKFWRGLIAKGRAVAMLEPKAAEKILPIYRRQLVAKGVPEENAEELAFACLWRTPARTIAAARR